MRRRERGRAAAPAGAMEKLALGTVQLGEVYGRHTEEGLPTPEQAISVLLEASRCGVSWIDTASNYGLAEERVGKALQAAGRDVSWQVVTKINEVVASGRRPDVLDAVELAAAVDASIEQSLRRLGGSSLDTCCAFSAPHAPTHHLLRASRAHAARRHPQC